MFWPRYRSKLLTSRQNDAPWGLQRISDRAKIVNGDATNLNYRYKRDGAGGQNVDIYVVG